VQDEKQSVEQVAEERPALLVRIFLGSATQPLQQPGDVIGDAPELDARAYGLVEEATLENVGGEQEQPPIDAVVQVEALDLSWADPRDGAPVECDALEVDLELATSVRQHVDLMECWALWLREVIGGCFAAQLGDGQDLDWHIGVLRVPVGNGTN
jgi:hypothetical protein